MEETLTHRQLQSLIHISNVLNTSIDIDTIIELIMRETISVVEAAEGGSLWLYDKNKDCLIAQSAQGVFYPKIFQQIRLKPGESMTGKTFEARNSLIFPNEKEIKKALTSLSSQNSELLRRSIPNNFSFSTVISSPIFLKGKCIGVFTLDSFQQSKNFKPEDTHLLEAICHQAAVAIERSSLYKEKEETVNSLSDSIEAHRTLANLVLQGEDLHSILQYIHQWIGQNTFLFDDLGELMASSYDPSLSSEILKFVKQQASVFMKSPENTLAVKETEIDGMPYHLVSLPLGSKPNFLGLLVILSTKKMADVDIAALEHACTVLSLELFKEQTLFDTQQRLKGEFVTRIFAEHMDDALIQKAKSLNLNPTRNYITIIIEFSTNSNNKFHPKDGLIRKIIQITNQAFLEQSTKGMTVRHHHQIVVLLSYHSNIAFSLIISRIKERAKWIQQEIMSRKWEVEVAFGIGRVKQGILNVHKSLQEAEKCLKFIQRINWENSIVSYTDLGIQRFILQNSEEEVIDFINEVLGPLIDYENSRKGDLLKTLYEYLEGNQNVKRTADALHVHINTLNYRLKRIEEILSIDLTDSKQLLNIHLAVSMFKYVKKHPTDPF
ncbi:helix-turn-helix domain-containing protein [Neobacillus ginsengisoli]|uniref:Sugar diacid utilization regulator n=1 Tax=Neobacillus ginsengisoli TaxID=904295 RepID=A0ABT9Y0W2_9BACI|nr:helix-turn-helix domain-containing protein [Neobacillus ginsengisoli]MDQ0201468.1 sugar diacid utilization regulator [Neobacillus ginsengisoli]